MEKEILYIHGQNGTPEEASHYRALFRNCNVIGLDYTARTPWEAKVEFPKLFDSVCGQHNMIIANSIGAYFAMYSLADRPIEKAYFISPVADMEKLICNMMAWANVSEDELCAKSEIKTNFGQTLSWEYLCYVRDHPIDWRVPTHILYGSKDNFTSYDVITRFAAKIGASLTVMDGGEHWFHTEKQMKFLDDWIVSVK